MPYPKQSKTCIYAELLTFPRKLRTLLLRETMYISRTKEYIYRCYRSGENLKFCDEWRNISEFNDKVLSDNKAAQYVTSVILKTIRLFDK